MLDDLLFDEDTNELDQTQDWDWVSIDFEVPEETKEEEVKEETTEEEVKEEETTTEETSETKEEIPEVKEEETIEDTTDDSELDLDKLFEDLDSELDTSKEALDKLETKGETVDPSDIWLVRDSLKRMEDQVKKLNNLNIDLKFKNAELEAFGVNDENPKLFIVSRHLKKAMDGDDKSKTKVTSTLKEILYDLTGEDFDETKIDKDIDLLTASEAYNTGANPNLKKKSEEEDFWIAL